MDTALPPSRAAQPDTTAAGWARTLATALAGVVALTALAGCGRSEPAAAIVKISIYRDGGLIVSGFRTDPDKFSAAVTRMGEKQTTVWLYDEPGPGVGAAIDRSVRAQLAAADIPYRIYTDEGFTRPAPAP